MCIRDRAQTTIHTTQHKSATCQHEHICETLKYQGYKILQSCLYSAAVSAKWWRVHKLNCQTSYSYTCLLHLAYQRLLSFQSPHCKPLFLHLLQAPFFQCYYNMIIHQQKHAPAKLSFTEVPTGEIIQVSIFSLN